MENKVILLRNFIKLDYYFIKERMDVNFKVVMKFYCKWFL